MNASYYIPTYKEAREWCNGNSDGNSEFYFKSHIVNGFRVDLFNYHSFNVWYKEFLPNKKEMRGLAFVFDESIDPTETYSIDRLSDAVYEVNPLLEKFWNVNQVEETSVENLSQYEVKHVGNKLDGSIISFIELPDGSIVCRSKMSFDSEHSNASMKYAKSNSELYDFISDVLSTGIIPIFEYVSKEHQIVLDYDETDLVLLQLRDMETGNYIDLDDMDIPESISVAHSYTEFIGKSIVDVMNHFESLEDIEGVVVTLLIDGNYYHVKYKTKWYFDRHKINTESLSAENTIIQLILDNTIDDALAHAPEDGNRYNTVMEIKEKLNKYFVSSMTELFPIVTECLSMEMKDVFLKYKTNKFRSIILLATRQYLKGNRLMTDILLELLIDVVRKETYRLQNAKEFLNNIEL